MTRLGFVGPARGDLTRLRALCEILLFDIRVDRVFHLGSDDSLDRAMHGWAEHLGAPKDDDALLDEVAALAPDAPAEVLEAMLARDARRLRLADVTDITSASGSRVEMVGAHLVLIAHDRAKVSDDDLANAKVVVHGNAPRADLRVLKNSGILSPGEIARSPHIAVLEEIHGGFRLALHDEAGVLSREVLLPLGRRAKMEVRP